MKEFDKLKQENIEKDRRIVLLEHEKAEDADEIRRLSRKLNRHCKLTLDEARAKFAEWYRAGHASQDALQVISRARPTSATSSDRSGWSAM